MGTYSNNSVEEANCVNPRDIMQSVDHRTTANDMLNSDEFHNPFPATFLNQSMAQSLETDRNAVPCDFGEAFAV